MVSWCQDPARGKQEGSESSGSKGFLSRLSWRPSSKMASPCHRTLATRQLPLHAFPVHFLNPLTVLRGGMSVQPVPLTSTGPSGPCSHPQSHRELRHPPWWAGPAPGLCWGLGLLHEERRAQTAPVRPQKWRARRRHRALARSLPAHRQPPRESLPAQWPTACLGLFLLLRNKWEL